MSLLANLPSRGNLTEGATMLSSRVPLYICEHDTAPPADQIISTDSTNILIRSLTLKKGKDDGKQKRGAGSSTSGKRPLEGAAAAVGGQESKKAKGKGKGKEEEGKAAKPTVKELEAMTVDRLKALLKEKNIVPRGRKEELLVRAKRALGYR